MKKAARIAGLKLNVRRTPLRRAVLLQRKAEIEQARVKEFLNYGEAAAFLGCRWFFSAESKKRFRIGSMVGGTFFIVTI